MLTQREFDVAQLEAELKIQRLYDEWLWSFLAERMLPPQFRATMQQPLEEIPAEEELPLE